MAGNGRWVLVEGETEPRTIIVPEGELSDMDIALPCKAAAGGCDVVVSVLVNGAYQVLDLDSSADHSNGHLRAVGAAKKKTAPLRVTRIAAAAAAASDQEMALLQQLAASLQVSGSILEAQISPLRKHTRLRTLFEPTLSGSASAATNVDAQFDDVPLAMCEDPMFLVPLMLCGAVEYEGSLARPPRFYTAYNDVLKGELPRFAETLRHALRPMYATQPKWGTLRDEANLFNGERYLTSSLTQAIGEACGNVRALSFIPFASDDACVFPGAAMVPQSGVSGLKAAVRRNALARSGSASSPVKREAEFVAEPSVPTWAVLGQVPVHKRWTTECTVDTMVAVMTTDGSAGPVGIIEPGRSNKVNQVASYALHSLHTMNGSEAPLSVMSLAGDFITSGREGFSLQYWGYRIEPGDMLPRRALLWKFPISPDDASSALYAYAEVHAAFALGALQLACQLSRQLAGEVTPVVRVSRTVTLGDTHAYKSFAGTRSKRRANVHLLAIGAPGLVEGVVKAGEKYQAADGVGSSLDGVYVLITTRITEVDNVTVAHFLMLVQRVHDVVSAGYVHGDIRRANVLFAADATLAYLIDFDYSGPADDGNYLYPPVWNEVDDGVRLPFVHHSSGTEGTMHPVGPKRRLYPMHDVYALGGLLAMSAQREVRATGDFLKDACTDGLDRASGGADHGQAACVRLLQEALRILGEAVQTLTADGKFECRRAVASGEAVGVRLTGSPPRPGH
eukprot:c19441_g2_i2.p1 GENE.c19441_g2_i2~~c19441_g2_i2.p1  ORF type:complete len:734 (-),score=75.41 c19441_g2_i2:73-2274(-)